MGWGRVGGGGEHRYLFVKIIWAANSSTAWWKSQEKKSEAGRDGRE